MGGARLFVFRSSLDLLEVNFLDLLNRHAP